MNSIFFNPKNESFKEKCRELNVSLEFFKIRQATDCIDLKEAIQTSSDYPSFRNKIIKELRENNNSHFLHTSFLFGLYFDTFNLYNYLYISPTIKKEIANLSPTSEDTYVFLKKHEEELYHYFNEKYDIDYEIYKKIVKSFFQVQNEEYILYRNEIIDDFLKVLIGNTLGYSYEGVEKSIENFERLNNRKNNALKK